ncbi:MAG: hypothetical protein OXI81_11520 [Paracoccaceae bacterium]|nr:hypothetical protein [Paracoccaceae bacterium]MDE2914593.1 hypothetical protein [Paracoccaceae bacterium]
MPERTDRDRRFRNMMYALILSALVAYLGYKFLHVSVAMNAWTSQTIDAGSLQAPR